MAYIVRMPKMGVEMQSGVLLDWFVAEGESVDEGDVIAEIESEKTTAEVTAREGGVLRRTLLEEGAEVAPGTAMGIVAAPDADIDELLATAADEGVDVAADGEEESGAGGTDTAGKASETPESGGSAEAKTAVENGGEPLATPRARKRAREGDVRLERIEGTGPHGSIRADDVDAALESRSQRGTASTESAAAVDEPSAGADGTDDTTAARTVVEERSLSGMRSTIARRLSESWEVPHVTVDRRIDAEAIFEAADEAGDGVSITDIVLKAVSESLAQHPTINSTFEDGVHRVYREHNIGFAVDVEQGLVTPVLRDVRTKSVAEIARERGERTDRVQNQRHDPSDLQNGTFTVSNLGMFGIDSFTPIINPPQVAILGVTAVREEPRRTERGLTFRRTIGFSLSFDHRVVDGADAARFLDTLATTLEAADELLEA